MIRVILPHLLYSKKTGLVTPGIISKIPGCPASLPAGRVSPSPISPSSSDEPQPNVFCSPFTFKLLEKFLSGKKKIKEKEKQKWDKTEEKKK